MGGNGSTAGQGSVNVGPGAEDLLPCACAAHLGSGTAGSSRLEPAFGGVDVPWYPLNPKPLGLVRQSHSNKGCSKGTPCKALSSHIPVAPSDGSAWISQKHKPWGVSLTVKCKWRNTWQDLYKTQVEANTETQFPLSLWGLTTKVQSGGALILWEQSMTGWSIPCSSNKNCSEDEADIEYCNSTY